jgi:3-oxoacyl-[acyl-carrier protein] reductase
MTVASSFAGTHAVVTGASSGIGQAVAIALAEAGVAKLLIHYCRNTRGADQTAERARLAGCDASTLAADLRSAEEADRLAEAAWARLGSVQTWVNNAGADVLTGPAGDLTFDEKLARLWAVDVAGTIRLSRSVATRLRDQRLSTRRSGGASKPASMTFIGWDQAARGMEGDAGQMFGPVKAAIAAFAASLAQQMGADVRVNTVAPGWIRTAWGRSTSEYWNRRAETQSLMSRWGQPEDVARAVLYVADPDNTFVTGQMIEVNGGWNRGFGQ